MKIDWHALRHRRDPIFCFPTVSLKDYSWRRYRNTDYLQLFVTLRCIECGREVPFGLDEYRLAPDDPEE